MSESNYGKKLLEEEHLGYFLEAYSEVTGVELMVLKNGESPDFLCTRPTGEIVGIELARSPHDYWQAIDDRIWTDRTMESQDLLAAVGEIISCKEKKLRSPHWRTPLNTILVVQLIDYTFDTLSWTKSSCFSDDFAETGFVEIWLADHSTLEAFGQVWLIGLYPTNIWGLHRQSALSQKPFG